MNNTDKKLMPPHRSMNPGSINPGSINPGAMDMDTRLTAALEHKPEPQIPANFAAKLAALAAVQPPRRRRIAPRFGSSIALLSVPITALALFALAPHTVPNLHNLSFDTELALLAELALIGWWISRTFGSRLSR